METLTGTVETVDVVGDEDPGNVGAVTVEVRVVNDCDVPSDVSGDAAV